MVSFHIDPENILHWFGYPMLHGHKCDNTIRIGRCDMDATSFRVTRCILECLICVHYVSDMYLTRHDTNLRLGLAVKYGVINRQIKSMFISSVEFIYFRIPIVDTIIWSYSVSISKPCL